MSAGNSEKARERPSSRTLSIPPQGGMDASVWGMLNDIITTLGDDKRSFWPFFETTGATLRNMARSGPLLPTDEVGAKNLEDEFTPILGLRASGLFAYNLSGDNSRLFEAADHADHSFEAADEAFGGALWVSLREAGSALQGIMGKYDEGVATEWTFNLSSAEALTLVLYDGIDGATGKLTAVDTGGAILSDRMQLLGFTFDGGLTTTGKVAFYVNGEQVSEITVTETSAYVNMDDTAAKFNVGGREDGSVPDDLLQGWVWGPMLAGKNLSASDHQDLFRISRNIVGV